MIKLWIFCCAIIPLIVMAQTYETSTIPDSLRTNSNAVLRFDELHVFINDIDKAVVKHKWAVTILNEEGDKFAYYNNDYNKLISLSDISGKLFDSEGKLIQKIKKKDIVDVSATERETLLDDSRVKYFEFHCKVYPYTVEFEDEQDFRGIYWLPYWQPINREYLSLQHSKFIVETPVDYHLRYKQFNYLSQPTIVTNNNTITFTWEKINCKSFEGEIWQPPIDEVTTKVYIAPTKFSIGGIDGEMNTWNNLGNFLNGLNKDRMDLPENVKREVHKIADALHTKKEKVAALYQYLQQNTRYISIQLGIGSWQPLEARFVAEKKFGDCKALSNFMVSILKEVGIHANYVLVESGRNKHFKLKEEFPAPYYFNHAIACVPDAKDTTWLECTNQTMSCGYLGSFTDNRKVLMLTDSGASVVLTPKYTAEDNLIITKVAATIGEDGILKSEIDTKYTGIKQDIPQEIFYGSTQKERDEYYNHKYDLPTYNVGNIRFNEIKGKIPVLSEHLSITSPNYATISGKRLFVQPDLLNRERKLPVNQERKFDIVYPESYTNVDSINILIPQGYIIESKPKDLKMETKFGNYSVEYKVQGNKVELIRKCRKTEQRFPASDYLELTKFYEEMSKADNVKMVFVKNTLRQ